MFIDIDHYFEHIIHSKSKSFSLISTWNNSIKLHRFVQRSFIHNLTGAVILSIIFVLISFLNFKIALTLFIGYYSHLYLDHIWVKKPHYLRFKIGKFYFKEAHFEVLLDIMLVIGIFSVYIF